MGEGKRERDRYKENGDRIRQPVKKRELRCEDALKN